MSRRRDLDELIRQKTLLGSQLSRRHPEYLRYAGAYYPNAHKMAIIKFVLDNQLTDNSQKPILKLIYDYLDEDRIAWFTTQGSDILTQLAILVGDTAIVRTATRIVSKTEDNE